MSRTKSEIDNEPPCALRIEPMTTEEILAMEGAGWDGDLKAMRTKPVLRTAGARVPHRP